MMKEACKVLVLTVSEFRSKAQKRELPKEHIPIILHLTQQEYEDAISGFKPSLGNAPPGPGLYIMPLPGHPGYLAFPICGPCEVPVISPDGTMRCVESEFENCDEPREPIPGGKPGSDVCRVTLAGPSGLISGCTGTCENGRCVKMMSYGNGIIVGCACIRWREVMKELGDN